MARKTFRLSHQAVADLEKIADYLGQRNLAASSRVLETLLRTFSALGENPNLGMQRDDLHEGIRMIVPQKPANNYIVFYYVTELAIEISDVIHGARDWPGMFVQGKR